MVVCVSCKRHPLTTRNIVEIKGGAALEVPKENSSLKIESGFAQDIESTLQIIKREKHPSAIQQLVSGDQSQPTNLPPSTVDQFLAAVKAEDYKDSDEALANIQKATGLSICGRLARSAQQILVGQITDQCALSIVGQELADSLSNEEITDMLTAELAGDSIQWALQGKSLGKSTIWRSEKVAIRNHLVEWFSLPEDTAEGALLTSQPTESFIAFSAYKAREKTWRMYLFQGKLGVPK